MRAVDAYAGDFTCVMYMEGDIGVFWPWNLYPEGWVENLRDVLLPFVFVFLQDFVVEKLFLF